MEKGDRIAQLILERIYTPEILEVEVSLLCCFSAGNLVIDPQAQELEETVRGAGGFGSTGGHTLLNAA